MEWEPPLLSVVPGEFLPNGANPPLPFFSARISPGLLSRDTMTLAETRSRLDQRRFSRPNMHFSAFFKIYKKI